MRRVHLLVTLSAICTVLSMTGCQETTGGPQACTEGDGKCGSLRCVDGFCCDSPCDGPCQACNLPGQEGRCTDTPDGQDPADECGICQVCDGQGACRDIPAGEDPQDDCDQWEESTCGLSGDCDGAGGCAYYGPETECDDQEPCTYDDHCDGQGGCSGTGISCEPDPDPCAFQPVCNGTDTCEETYPGVNTPCDDDDPCTHDDRCDGQGGCAGTVITCDDDPGPCGANRECDGTDTCVVSYPGSETACQDDDPCTHDDSCDGQGGCAGTEIICEDGPGPCGALRDCNGTDACTVSYPPEGITCDDGRFCTVGDQCDGAGACSPGPDTPCQAGEVCYEDEDQCCQPGAYTACGTGNDVYWFDSCDHQGGIHEDCPDPNGECSDGACYCRNQWTGADCLTCPGNWDPAQDCAACPGNWDPDQNCDGCLPDHVGLDCEIAQCVRYVNPLANPADPDGSTWDRGFSTVQEGINAAYNAVQTDPAIDDCQVWVIQGTYYIYETDPTDTVQLRPDVSVFGGFAGGETALEQRDWSVPTVLDGHEFEASASQVYHVVTASNGLIDGFSITGGNANGSDSDSKGGGMYISAGSPTVVNCIITGNQASFTGGGVYIDSSSDTAFDNCTVSLNTSWANGGGIYVIDSVLSCVGCVISGNSVTGGSGEMGGGIHLESSDAMFDECFFTDNTATGQGGGISCWNTSTAEIANSTISGNVSEVFGGGVFLSDCYSVMDNCVIADNSASLHGGGLNVLGDTQIFFSDIVDNTAGTGGGGVCFGGGGTPVLANSLVSGNSSEGGGGVQIVGSNARIIDCEISQNSTHTDGNGGGIYSDFSDPYIDGCYIWGNQTDEFGHGGGIFIVSSTTGVITNSVISDNISPHDGGGICVGASEPEISNCIITGNTALSRGGGINFFGSGAQTKVVNCTIVGNTASAGDGITCADGSVLTLVNSILWNNSPMEIYVPDWGNPGTINVGYSDIMGGQDSLHTSNNATVNWLEGNVDVDPLFVDPGTDNFHLGDYSPCIDVGTDPSAFGVVVDEDFEMDARPQGGGWDIGADECATNQCNPCIPDCTGRVCGPDPVCGQSCGECPVGETCQNGMCI